MNLEGKTFDGFADYVYAQPQDDLIDHDSSWCGCAVGEYLECHAEDRATANRYNNRNKLRGDRNVIQDATEWVRANLPIDVIYRLNYLGDQPDTYGDLAEMIAQWRLDNDV